MAMLNNDNITIVLGILGISGAQKTILLAMDGNNCTPKYHKRTQQSIFPPKTHDPIANDQSLSIMIIQHFPIMWVKQCHKPPICSWFIPHQSGHGWGMVYDMVLITLTTRLVGITSNYQHKHVDKLYEPSIHYPSGNLTVCY
jgi:hypothetical protein